MLENHIFLARKNLAFIYFQVLHDGAINALAT